MSRIAYLFPGQGSQVVGMGKGFHDRSDLARTIFARADEILGYPISRLCFEGPEEELKLTRNTQPALLIVSHIAASLFDRVPVIAAGHSLGEYSALVAAGALRFEDAVLLVHKRGRYMQDAVPVGQGAMAAVLGMCYEDLGRALAQVTAGVVQIANWNSQEQIVIAGHKAAVEEALKIAKPPRAMMLPVSAPFHSVLMKSAEDRLAVDLDRTEFKDPRYPVVTNVDARAVRTGAEARDALKRQVSRPVLWYKSMELLGQESIDVFVELGSGRVLTGLLKRIGRGWTHPFTMLGIEDVESLEKAKGSVG
ncbi:MAG: ACP S-malonyltransferase [Candidatus Aminicenantes bacterium]|nr:ACP S-malonyltransferase [Candidatus Aminicenantes bacterium]